MKVLLVLLMLGASGLAFGKVLETKCNNNNCFENGWTTTEPGTDYLLEAKCLKNDCLLNGWSSLDNRDSSYHVKCKAEGCFTKGWVSIQNDEGKILVDITSCKNNDCLSNGWDISTSYGQDGEAICKNDNCREFGGISYWRNRISETSCLNSDCYTYGWNAEIQED